MTKILLPLKILIATVHWNEFVFLYKYYSIQWLQTNYMICFVKEKLYTKVVCNKLSFSLCPNSFDCCLVNEKKKHLWLAKYRNKLLLGLGLNDSRRNLVSLRASVTCCVTSFILYVYVMYELYDGSYIAL